MLRMSWSNKNIAIVKVLIILSLVFVMSFSVPIFSQTISDLEQANLYFSKGQYAEAESLYQKVIAQQPGTREAAEAGKQLVLVYVYLKNWEQAKTAYQQLSTDTTRQAEVTNIAGDIAYTHLMKYRFQDAQDVYKLVVDDWSQREHALWIPTCQACASITEDDPNTAQTLVDQLLTEYPDHQQIAKAINKIGDYYRKQREYDHARKLYQNVVDRWPQAEYALWSLKSLAISQIHLGQESAAQTSVARLLGDYTKHEELPKAIQNIADTYRDERKHAEARSLYQHTVDTQTPSDLVFSALKEVAIASVKLKDDSLVQQAVAKLSTDFAAHPEIATAINKIGDHYRKVNRYDQARSIYQQVVAQWPQDEYAFWAQKSLILCYFHEQDPNKLASSLQEAEEAVEVMKTKYSTHPELAKALFQIAWEMAERDQEKAYALCQSIVSDHPEAEFTVFAQAYLGILELNQDRETEAENIFTQVITDQKDHSLLPRVIVMIADGYYKRAISWQKQGEELRAQENYHQAITMWQKIIREFPNASSFTIAEAHIFSGDSLYELKEYADAIEQYKEVVSYYPDFIYASTAQFRIGTCYMKMKQADLLSAEQAETSTRTAYELLLQNYPDSPVVKAARLWLKNHSK